MKILVVSNMGPSRKAPNYGVFVKNFCNRIGTMGIDYNWIYIKKSTNKLIKILRYVLYFLKCFCACLFIHYDYVYVHYLAISGIPVFYAHKIKKIKIICNAHGTDLAPENHIQEKHLENTRRILGVSHSIVVPSEYFKHYLEDNFSEVLCDQEIFIYPSGGIDEKTFFVLSENEKQKVYKHLNLSTEKKYIGYCGRISPNKGIDTLLDAFALLKEKKDLELVIVGTGEYDEKMRVRARELGIDKEVHFYPMMVQNELREVYNILELFIFPTERVGESLGLVSIEAMACGTPVIASDFAAPHYYIYDGYNGYKFITKNAEDLKKKIYTVLEDESLHSKMSKNAVEFAKQYSANNTMNILYRLFEIS